MNKFYYLFFLILTTHSIFSRSIHRDLDPEISSLTINYDGDPKPYNLVDPRLRELPLFKTFKADYFADHQIPEKISLRYNPEKEVSGEKIKEILEDLIKEIKAGKREFTNFKILKQRDFNYFNKCGLLVLKFKDENYPFIFKLFIECPKSIIKPDSKSFQTRGVFYLGGAFRHVVGYTRIRNIDLMKEKIDKIPYWKDKVDFPRKWYWTPQETKWIHLTGHKIGILDEQKISLPSTYGLLCDFIKEDDKKDSKIKRDYLKLCSDLEFIQDPLPSNFKAGNGKIIIIDSESFTTLIGIDKKLKPYDKYSSYWAKIMGKYVRDRFFTTREQRRLRQRNSKHLFPLFEEKQA